jgi:hypothetical protein
MKEDQGIAEKDKLQHAKAVITAFDFLKARLASPCVGCPKKPCPSAQCKSDAEITICQAKTAFVYVCSTLEFLSGRRIKFSKKLTARAKRRIYAKSK